MSSTLIVEIKKVSKVEVHPQADRLDIIQIGGWQSVVSKGTLKEGDLVVFIPPDSVLPESLHSFLGITKYCGELPKLADGTRPTERRVKACRLRGVPSYGTIMTLLDLCSYGCENMRWLESRFYKEGTDVAEFLDITKWEPPIKSTQGDQEKDSSLFFKYTNIENYRNFPDRIHDGEMVRVSCKIHGSNCRLGLVEAPDENGNATMTFMAGSHNTRRKEYTKEDKKCLYWEPLEWYPQIKDLLTRVQDDTQAKSVVLYCEIYGDGIQDLKYGLENGKKDIRCFDLSIDGKYVDFQDLNILLATYKLPTVELVYRGPFSRNIIEEHTDGPSFPPLTGKFKGREGIVITPLIERDDHVGRVILKSISVDYLSRKGAKDER